MANTEGRWRLSLIIGLFLMLTVMYTAYGIFNPDTMSARYNTNDPNYNPYTPTKDTINGSSKLDADYDYDTESSESFIDVVFGFGSFLTFGGIDNGMVRLMFNLFTTINFICIGYVIYSFVRDWVPFV